MPVVSRKETAGAASTSSVATVTRASTPARDTPVARVRESAPVIGLSFLRIVQAVPFHGAAGRALGQREIADPDPRSEWAAAGREASETPSPHTAVPGQPLADHG